ncbi:NAD(P)/FAD-dependent oxidoreductase [Paenibacillus tyrfis]|uniref:Ferredoxin--NADP reductase n=1 Tax=Paenibacillus tyrfis TaxID=1501230 RepID=A0A081P7Z1_9BACL|nr:NAD(P)/FAD-dependent oxidoreductase [Paenibacillus tyrfis]KEQ26814.1 thioredoxin reductase [Paenibacillus tyrfis]
MTEPLELYDVTIIGGGPAGMYTAFYSGMRDLKTKLIEAKTELGGFLHMYPEKMIWDVGGITPLRCEQLIRQLDRQARTFEPTIVLGQQIEGLERLEDGTFMLTAATGERHHTRTIILTLGRGITNMQKLELEGANRYEITNLYYTVQELKNFLGKRVLISGGGNSAVDWANELEEIAASVTVVHRRNEFDAMEKHVAHMRQFADVRTPYTVTQLHGQGDAIHQVTVTHAETGEKELLEVDAVIINHGFTRNYGSIAEWGLQMKDGIMVVNEKMETNIPGIFAAGDFVTHASKVRLIAGAFADAILALNSAKLYMDPEAPRMAYVSSHNERFKEKNRAYSVANVNGQSR